MEARWFKWLSQWENLGRVTFPRCLKPAPDNDAYLHVFCDASEKAYGAVAYVVQAAGVGLVGSVVGAVAGVALQVSLPTLLGDLLPVDVAPEISWSVSSHAASSRSMLVQPSGDTTVKYQVVMELT